MVARMRSWVSLLTSGLLFKTRETVETETPAFLAMSMIVAVMHRYPSTYKRNLPVTLLVTFPILHTKPQCWILQAKNEAIEKRCEECPSEFIEQRGSSQDEIMNNAPVSMEFILCLNNRSFSFILIKERK